MGKVAKILEMTFLHFSFPFSSFKTCLFVAMLTEDEKRRGCPAPGDRAPRPVTQLRSVFLLNHVAYDAIKNWVIWPLSQCQGSLF